MRQALTKLGDQFAQGSFHQTRTVTYDDGRVFLLLQLELLLLQLLILQRVPDLIEATKSS